MIDNTIISPFFDIPGDENNIVASWWMTL